MKLIKNRNVMKASRFAILSVGLTLSTNSLLASQKPIAPFFEQDSGVVGASGLVKTNRLQTPLTADAPGYLVNPQFRIHGKYSNGMSIAEEIKTNIKPNAQGNFIFAVESNEALATSTYATVDYVFSLHRKDIEYLANKNPENENFKKALERWNNPTVNGKRMDAIWINHMDNSDTNNAFYSRYLSDDFTIFWRDLNFFPLTTGGYTSHSFDIVAHETGHAALDMLQPEYFSQFTVFNAAYHEAYGDITAFLSLMRQETMAKKIMIEMMQHNGPLDLRKVTYIHQMAENFGKVFGTVALRNLDKNVHVLKAGKTGRLSTEPHDLSGPISGAIYDVTADCLNRYMTLPVFRETPDDSKYKVVIKAGEYMSLLLHKWGAESKPTFTFEDMGKQLMAIAKNDSGVDKDIEKAFTVRGMLGDEAAHNMQRLLNSRSFA